MPKFNVDEANNDNETFYVDIEGMGTVQIKATDCGITTNIFPLHVVDEPLASTFVAISALIENE